MSAAITTIRDANASLLVRGELDAIAEFFAPEYVVHLTDRDLPGGHDIVRKIVTALRRSFSDLEVDVEVLVEGDERVAWQRTFRGVHTKAYQGFPATRRSMIWRDMVTSQMHDGRIAEEWVISDLAERLMLARKG